MPRYYHVTNKELNLDQPSSYPTPRLIMFGKPIGLWYAPDTAWIDRELKEGTPTYKYKYEFPLEGKFVDDISKPDKTKILRLTSANIDTFERSFEPYLSEKRKTVKPRLYVIMLNSIYSSYKALLTDEEKLTIKDYDKFLLKHATSFVKGSMTHPKISTAIRLIEYGNFLNEKLKPIWGGIDYDASLFTDDLKAKYPFIKNVEIPSGCLWHPKDVMPDYVPKIVQGGQRTRRNKLRKTTRRRRQ